ncbi:hypothetical protein LIER_19887 [Lithospermum erythrorhizon]|uniref:Retrotransposon gag domain-containing protein n=1 Tax=Lithospermum erythrorhizon TaxID=34254 RepID=A0AAV3QLQ8_LITER
MPIVVSRKECKIKIPFTDRLDGIPLPRGFILPQFTQFNGTDKALDWYMTLSLKSIDTYQQKTDSFIPKFGSAIQAHQGEQELMDIEQWPNESLRSYHKRYNDILLTIPEVNNKIA